jgi:hypothetical protein
VSLRDLAFWRGQFILLLGHRSLCVEEDCRLFVLSLHPLSVLARRHTHSKGVGSPPLFVRGARTRERTGGGTSMPMLLLLVSVARLSFLSALSERRLCPLCKGDSASEERTAPTRKATTGASQTINTYLGGF